MSNNKRPSNSRSSRNTTPSNRSNRASSGRKSTTQQKSRTRNSAQASSRLPREAASGTNRSSSSARRTSSQSRNRSSSRTSSQSTRRSQTRPQNERTSNRTRPSQTSARRSDTRASSATTRRTRSTNSATHSKQNASIISVILNSRKFLLTAILVCAILLGFGIDRVAHINKAYNGVYIGEVDVSGMTAPQMKDALKNYYDPIIQDKHAYIIADEDARKLIGDEAAKSEEEALAQQVSLEEAIHNKQLWDCTASSLGVTPCYDKSITEALRVGRDSSAASRGEARRHGVVIPLNVDFDADLFEALTTSVSSSLGYMRTNANITVENGAVYVVEGEDGLMVNNDELKNQLTDIFVGNVDDQAIVPTLYDTPSITTNEQAQQVCDLVQSFLNVSGTFSWGEPSWSPSSTELGKWITTEIEELETGGTINVLFDREKAAPAIVDHLISDSDKPRFTLSFESDDDGQITTYVNDTTELPNVDAALTQLEDTVFSNQEVTECEPFDISMDSTQVEPVMSFEQARTVGAVVCIGKYTTTFSNSAGTENRNFNIKLVSDILNNSIVKSGTEWSFNDRAGNCNEEAGFLPAGAINEGEYIQDVGGGICQVATTIYNAVYESGLKIPARTNHSLYIASYPAGRDAAVSYPGLDLVWFDNSDSDVLLKLSYTDTSVTASLYSAPTGLEVESITGAWVAGKPYKTRVEYSDELSPGVFYTKSSGVDGQQIATTRKVYDRNGTLLYTDQFSSVYEPKNKVILAAPDAEIPDEELGKEPKTDEEETE